MSFNEKRVVITGLGVVSNIGLDVSSFWDSLMAGRSGIRPITAFDASPYKTRIAGDVQGFSLPPHQSKRLERFSQFAVSAAAQALAQAGLLREDALAQPGQGGLAPDRVGVTVGTGIGGFPMLEEEHAKFLQRGAGKFHPLTVPIIIANMAAANVSLMFGLKGPNYCVTSACATGNHSLGAGLDMIRAGRADAVLAGGVESTLSPFALNGYIQLKALSTRNDDPAGASRPFSLGRDGFVLAEGGGVVVLESLDSAKARGVEILAELAAVGMSSDAYHLTAPDPEGHGAVRAMSEALREAGISPQQVSYINAHGTSTPLNDQVETLAVKRVFGGAGQAPPISSIKSMVGHSLGGAAGIEAVASVMTLLKGVIPPTINLHEPDPELDLDYVPLKPREAKVDTVMSNAFGFGGHNAVSLFRRF
ncbi:MAG: beta-ketoacyl-ACP synthase II [Deltaproteobacteria bacterium]|nr:beta-ketoacyl-ACP synthase II [Deltaproteobacteria bacterium]